MTTRTAPFDAADYLTSAEDIEAYLEAALEENDPVFFQKALGTVARAQGMQVVASRSRTTRAGLYKALSDEGNPSFGTVLKVVNALGYRLALVSGKKTARVSKRIATKRPAQKDVATRKTPTRLRKHA